MQNPLGLIRSFKVCLLLIRISLEKYGIGPSNNMQLFRAKRKVLETNNDIHIVSYNDLSPWVVVIRNSNKGSIVKLCVKPRVSKNPQFKRIFVCMDVT